MYLINRTNETNFTTNRNTCLLQHRHHLLTYNLELYLLYYTHLLPQLPTQPSTYLPINNTAMSSTAFVSLALASAIFSSPLASAFSHAFTKPKSYHRVSFTELKYRSLHHGPDVEPPSDTEKQGADFTKMDKDKVHRYGPGDFAQYADSHSSDAAEIAKWVYLVMGTLDSLRLAAMFHHTLLGL